MMSEENKYENEPQGQPPPYYNDPAFAGYVQQPEWTGPPPSYTNKSGPNVGPDSTDGMPLFTAPLYHTPGPGAPCDPIGGGGGAPLQQLPPYMTQPMSYNMNQPAFVYVQPNPLSNPPNDYMGYSLFVTICCCWIVGLFAIMKSSECRSAIAVGDRATAETKSREAKKYSNVALALGIVVVCVTAAILGVYYGLVFGNYRYGH